MNRGNVILVGLLVVLAGVYFLTRDRGPDADEAPAPRFFKINKETVDRITLEGGWEKTRWVFARAAGGDWVLESAGGFPAKSETAQTFIDAVANLRMDNRTGTGQGVWKDTRTDGLGRLVRLEQAGTKVAEFLVGKTPPRTGQQYFVRNKGDDVVYRTRTLLTKDLENMGGPPSDNPWDRGPTGFRWDDYTSQLRDWVDTSIWRLGGEETQKVRLVRAGRYEVIITRKSAEVWELKKAGEEQAMPADTDVATGFADDLRYLSLTDIVGRYEQVVTEYGLDKPEITLVLTLKKKIEKKEEEDTADDEEEKEGDKEKKEKKEEKKKPKDEFKLVKRTIEIGKKVERPESIDAETGEVKMGSFYAVHIGGTFDDDEKLAERAKFVYLVDAVTLRRLRKDFSELIQKEEEEKKPDEEEGKEPGDTKQPGSTLPDAASDLGAALAAAEKSIEAAVEAYKNTIHAKEEAAAKAARPAFESGVAKCAQQLVVLKAARQVLAEAGTPALEGLKAAIAKLEDEQLKKAAEERYKAVSERYESIDSGSDEALKAYEEMVNTLDDQRKAIGDEVKLDGLKELQKGWPDLEKQAGALKELLQKAADACEDPASLSTQLPAPAVEKKVDDKKKVDDEGCGDG